MSDAQSPSPRLPDVDAAALAALRATWEAQLQRHEAGAAAAAPERAMYAWSAVAIDRRELALIAYAAGAPLPEVRAALAAAARAYLEAVRHRGPRDAPARGLPDYSTGHSRRTYLAACMALAAGARALAVELAPYAWDPPGASYVGAGSLLCTSEQQVLAGALRDALLGDAAAARSALSAPASIGGETIGEWLLLRGIVDAEAPRIHDGLRRALQAHAALAAAPSEALQPQCFVCLPALGLAALALQQRLVRRDELPAGDPHFPRELPAADEEAAT